MYHYCSAIGKARIGNIKAGVLMKDLFDLFVEILSRLNLAWAGGWIVALFSIGIIFRKPVARLWSLFLNWIATSFENELGYRRFEPEYRKYIQEYHLHLKIVGL